MDWTSFEGYPFYHSQPEIDLCREIMRSVKATTAFLAVLSITAIILAGQMSGGADDASTECLPSVALSPEAGMTGNCGIL